MSDDFLPQGTSIPSSDRPYMKFTEPENRFRVLGSAVIGFELWVQGKPLRRKEKQFTADELLNADINKFTGKKKTPQYFWAFPVYNYQTEKIEILEVTQVTIMRGIQDYLDDPDYGNPRGYDLNVIRDESGDKVEYRVKAKPPKMLNTDIAKAFGDMGINLQALFKGEDPFQAVDETEPEGIAEDAVAAGL
jgi:hypothetical protein